MPRTTVRALTAVNRSLATRPFSAIAPRYHPRPQHAEQNKNQGDNAAPAAATNEMDEGSGMRRRKGQEPPKLISDIAKLKANMDYVSEAEKKSYVPPSLSWPFYLSAWLCMIWMALNGVASTCCNDFSQTTNLTDFLCPVSKRYSPSWINIL